MALALRDFNESLISLASPIIRKRRRFFIRRRLPIGAMGLAEMAKCSEQPRSLEPDLTLVESINKISFSAVTFLRLMFCAC